MLFLTVYDLSFVFVPLVINRTLHKKSHWLMHIIQCLSLWWAFIVLKTMGLSGSPCSENGDLLVEPLLLSLRECSALSRYVIPPQSIWSKFLRRYSCCRISCVLMLSNFRLVSFKFWKQ